MEKPKLSTIALGTALGLLGGCADTSKDFKKAGTFEGYPVKTWRAANMTNIRVEDANDRRLFIYALDNAPPDGRFDEIKLVVPKGHPLEQYASERKLEEIFAHVQNQ